MKNKYLNIFREISYVSSITKVNKKKIRILFSAVLANLTVLLDILIILIEYVKCLQLKLDNWFLLEVCLDYRSIVRPIKLLV